MAPLQMTLENLDGIDDSIKSFYIEKDGKFVLDVDGNVNPNDPNKIPKSRLDEVLSKLKTSESSLAEVAESFVESIPEDMRDIIPDLPPAKKIKWIQQANAKGFFNDKETPPIDQRRPNSQPPTSQTMSPVQRMATGYNK